MLFLIHPDPLDDAVVDPRRRRVLERRQGPQAWVIGTGTVRAAYGAGGGLVAGALGKVMGLPATAEPLPEPVTEGGGCRPLVVR
jgi:hypothetical protein